jgi:hypothetical protein
VFSASPSEIRTIFFERLGNEEAKLSAKLNAPERLDSGSRGYINSSLAIMVSTSPTPSIRREISSLGVPEKEIR